MEKRKLLFGFVIGAIIGASVTILDKDVRNFTKNRLISAKDKTNHIVKNPSKTVADVRMKLNNISETLSHRAGQAIHTLEKLEQTLDQFTRKN